MYAFCNTYNMQGTEGIKDHLPDCCFCITKITDFSGKNKKSVVYPPRTFKEWHEKSDDIFDSTDLDFITVNAIEPHLITQAQLNNLVC